MLHADMLFKPVALAPPDWPARLQALTQTARDPRLRGQSAAGCVPGDTPLAQVPLVAPELETTGLDPLHDGIVSIGVVPFALDRIRASQARHWRVQPRVGLVEASVALHGITHSRLAQAPDLDQVLAEVLAMLAGQVVVVHCSAVERGFLSHGLQRRLWEDFHLPCIDTMALEARRERQAHRPSWLHWLLHRLPRAPAPAVSLRLAACRERHGLPRDALHHALTAALASAELLLAQLAHHHSPDTPVQALCC